MHVMTAIKQETSIKFAWEDWNEKHPRGLLCRKHLHIQLSRAERETTRTERGSRITEHGVPRSTSIPFQSTARSVPVITQTHSTTSVLASYKHLPVQSKKVQVDLTPANSDGGTSHQSEAAADDFSGDTTNLLDECIINKLCIKAK